MADRDERGRARPPGPPRPTSCQACPATVVFLPSQPNPGRFICANVKGVRQFVAVHRDDPLMLADQAAIDAGLAVWRQVLTYTSHHAGYPEVPPCPGASQYSRARKATDTSTTTAHKR